MEQTRTRSSRYSASGIVPPSDHAPIKTLDDVFAREARL